MRVYIIRFQDPNHGAGFAELVAGTEADAREEFEHKWPEVAILSSHEKPGKPWTCSQPNKRSDDGMEVNPEKINMIQSTGKEAVHLFNVMTKFQSECSIEINTNGHSDPFVSMAGCPVEADYFAYDDMTDVLVVTLGEAEFAFEVDRCAFSKEIGNVQISLLIANNEHAAWFSSGILTPQAIDEAKNFEG